MDERRKERISMAREICLHRGENPNIIDRNGNQSWEKYEPLAGAAIREAERLFALRSAPSAPAQGALDGTLDEIAVERQRQIGKEGWTLEHDDSHISGEMAAAAACYALSSFLNTEHSLNTIFTRYWPWDRKWWKPECGRRDLIRAAALIVAEIERMDRTTLTSTERCDGADDLEHLDGMLDDRERG